MSTSETRLRSQLWFHESWRSRQHRHPYRTLHEFRDHPRGAPVGQPHHRHRPVGKRSLSLQPRAPAALGAGAGRDPGGGRGPARVSGPPHPGDRQAAYRGARPQSRLSRAGRGACTDYPLDGVVLTTGCDKTTPSQLMAAATVNIPAIVLSGGPMLDGWYKGQLTGSGTILWEARKLYAAGGDRLRGVHRDGGLVGEVGRPLQHDGHRVDDELPRRGARDGPSRVRGDPRPLQGAGGRSRTGRDGASSRDGPRGHHPVEDHDPRGVRERHRRPTPRSAARPMRRSTSTPLPATSACRSPSTTGNGSGTGSRFLVNMQPAGDHLGEGYFRAGGLPAVMGELLRAGKLYSDAVTVNGRTVGENYSDAHSEDTDVVRPFDPVRSREDAGFVVLKGNLFDAAIMKTSVIDETFRRRYLGAAGAGETSWKGGRSSSTARRTITAVSMTRRSRSTRNCFLVIRGCGPVGYPGSAEVVNMQPPDELIKRGIRELPTIGDGRQSGTSGSPSILNASPESRGRGQPRHSGDERHHPRGPRGRGPSTCWFRTRSSRRAASGSLPPDLPNHTPWQEIYRAHVGQLADGGGVRHRHQVPRT